MWLLLASALLSAAPEPGGPRLPEYLTLPSIEERSEPARRWYGWQNLLVEASAVGLAALAASTETEGLLYASAALGTLGSPLVHLAHGQVGAGLGSFGLQLGLPLAGGLAGALARSGPVDDIETAFSMIEGAAIGGLIGKSVAVALDAALLAWEDAPAVEPSLEIGPEAVHVGVRVRL